MKRRNSYFSFFLVIAIGVPYPVRAEAGFANVYLKGGVDKFSAGKWECLVGVFLSA